MFKANSLPRTFLVVLLLLGLSPSVTSDLHAQTTKVKKVLFQGFWWDYKNDNFPSRWSNYLTELTPRLRAIGIDAVWIPPSYKNGFTGSVGYSPFDQYDLGDKYQKGGSDSITVRTRMGNKDELLRMIAVMHANGMEVLQDVVLNHVDQAGVNAGGIGGQDPEPTYSMYNASGYKNFRYVSYATPMLDESQNDYWTRGGRWPKNYANFYPYPGNFCTTGDICSPFFGPDIAFEDNAFGQSTNIPTSGSATIGAVTRAYVNPAQTTRHMRNNARDWIMWLKRQTGVDGWRWDAVKHFPIYAQEDLIYNTKYLGPAFAQGGEAMFNIGEWIGTKSELDAYVTNVRSGLEEHTGTFDFSLRGYSPSGGLYSMVHGFDGYNMQELPNEQQNKRYYDYATQRVHRTLPFVNSHDTYRPIVDPVTGNFSQPLGTASGWNTGGELGGNGQHIDPREPRLFAAYATVFAMDGNPTVFFEDLFDIGTTSKRFTHLPTNPEDLPIRPDIVNIIQAHQKLQYKNGDYRVPTTLTGGSAPFYQTGSSGDHLVIERRGRAIIGISDKYSTVSNNSADQEVYVSVDDPSWYGLQLYDYSGAHGVTTTQVFNDGRVLIKTAPVGHTINGARGHGYSIWAPAPTGVTFTTVPQMYDYLATYAPGRTTNTVQEWEMADDLGDSHALSLKQGGRLPNNSIATRTAGRIYVQSGKRITYKVTPTVNSRSLHIGFYRTDGTLAAQTSGNTTIAAPLSGSFTPNITGWLSVRVRNANATQAGQVVRVNLNYTAPIVIDTRSAPGNQYAEPDAAVSRDEPLTEETLTEIALRISPNPTSGEVNFQIEGISDQEILRVELFDLRGQLILAQKGNLNDISTSFNEHFGLLSPGTYFLNAQLPGKRQHLKLVKL